jgi:hypothetical protein
MGELGEPDLLEVTYCPPQGPCERPKTVTQKRPDPYCLRRTNDSTNGLKSSSVGVFMSGTFP